MPYKTPIHVLIAVFLAIVLVAAGCSDDSEPAADVSGDDGTTEEADDGAEEEPEPDPSEETEDAVDEEPEPDVVEEEPEEEPEPEPEPTLEGELVGLFSIDAADCTVAGSETGSFFQMVLIDGTTDGPYIANADSTCADQTITPLSPGSDGGLVTGSFQPGDDPLFDDTNNATAGRIAAPAVFFGTDFGLATTDEADPPMIIATAGELSGDLAAISAYWGGQIFNQGSPKPDGSTPGITSIVPTGTIDPDTGAFTLEWASQIVGGAFNDFTGIWHLQGTFSAS